MTKTYSKCENKWIVFHSIRWMNEKNCSSFSDSFNSWNCLNDTKIVRFLFFRRSKLEFEITWFRVEWIKCCTFFFFRFSYIASSNEDQNGEKQKMKSLRQSERFCFFCCFAVGNIKMPSMNHSFLISYHRSFSISPFFSLRKKIYSVDRHKIHLFYRLKTCSVRLFTKFSSCTVNLCDNFNRNFFFIWQEWKRWKDDNQVLTFLMCAILEDTG